MAVVDVEVAVPALVLLDPRVGMGVAAAVDATCPFLAGTDDVLLVAGDDLRVRAGADLLVDLPVVLGVGPDRLHIAISTVATIVVEDRHGGPVGGVRLNVVDHLRRGENAAHLVRDPLGRVRRHGDPHVVLVRTDRKVVGHDVVRDLVLLAVHPHALDGHGLELLRALSGMSISICSRIELLPLRPPGSLSSFSMKALPESAPSGRGGNASRRGGVGTAGVSGTSGDSGISGRSGHSGFPDVVRPVSGSTTSWASRAGWSWPEACGRTPLPLVELRPDLLGGRRRGPLLQLRNHRAERLPVPLLLGEVVPALLVPAGEVGRSGKLGLGHLVLAEQRYEEPLAKRTGRQVGPLDGDLSVAGQRRAARWAPSGLRRRSGRRGRRASPKSRRSSRSRGMVSPHREVGAPQHSPSRRCPATPRMRLTCGGSGVYA